MDQTPSVKSNSTLDVKRPLMLTLYTADDGAPTLSEREALELGGVSADALVVIRALFNGPELVIQASSVNGLDMKPVSLSALFHMWVSLTGHIARMELPTDHEVEEAQVVFLRKILATMALTPELGPIAVALSAGPAEATPTAPSEPSSPAAPPSPAGDDPSSTG